MENNKTTNNKAKVGKVQVISSEALALAGKISAKFPASDYKEVYELLNDFIDSLNVDEDGAITLEMFWDCADCNDSEDCEDCCAVEDEDEECVVENVDNGIVSLFNSIPNTISLNEMIDSFEEQFDTDPYLVMDIKTLELFEYIQRVDCLDFDNTGIDCDDFENCEGCPFDPEAEGCVTIENDDEADTIRACYYHNDKEYIILIDNTLAFGVVKVR